MKRKIDVAGEAHSEGLSFHPLQQFEVHPLFGDGPIHWYTITNATVWLLLAAICVIGVFVLGSAGRKLVPSRMQSVGELGYDFVRNMVVDVTGEDGAKYFPMVMTLFLTIVFSNILGLLPGSFSPTSHIAVTAVMGIGVFLFVTLLGLYKHGMHFLGLFWMKDAPLILRPVIAIIELISYFVRPVSHSIRLAGNIMAGHAVMKVFAAFAPMILISGIGVLVTPVSILAITAIYALEVLVAFIQAYVFTILTCVYLKDALHPGH
ncbi:F0F1 ATP synthase subunit A [Cypionkella sp.]|uniref:F0F1 ATP synthase subunit A n=1 Tax=Cypionkella sp. TaxID=2811411 RepID=UPI002621D6AA|nr:F0F1 ATP synthase subunit A [Cypionkella sp.]MDB5663490.1 synthase subunit a [Cypionkella sp.]